MEKEDLQELADQILSQGFQKGKEIVLFEGKILDGRNRYRACKIAKVKPRFVKFEKGHLKENPWDFVWRENLSRFHANEGQRCAMRILLEEGTAKWLVQRQAEEEEAERKANEARSKYAKGRRRKKGGKFKKKASRSSTGTATGDRNPSRAARAKRAGVSPAIQAKMDVLKLNAPDLFEAVLQGKMTAARAYREWRKRERKRKLDEARQGAAKREQEKAQTQVVAWDLWLDCHSEQEIAERLGVGLDTVNVWIALEKSAPRTPPDSQQHFDVWNFGPSSGDAGDTDYFGHMPPQVVENLLWLFTEPGQIIFDPFAGGGTTYDVAKRMGRRVWTSDLAPTATFIHEHDILSGWPAAAPPEANLILLDPPYFIQARGRYCKHKSQMGDMAELSAFMEAWGRVVQVCREHLSTQGHLAFIISPTQMKDGTVIDHAFQMAQDCVKAKLVEVRRVIVTYNTQQATGQQVEWARAHRKLLKLYRDLIVWANE